jgi:hypothetical protein
VVLLNAVPPHDSILDHVGPIPREIAWPGPLTTSRLVMTVSACALRFPLRLMSLAHKNYFRVEFVDRRIEAGMNG